MMQGRGATGLVLLLAFGAGAIAYRLDFNAYVAFAAVAIVGVVLICALVMKRARRELAESRARLMRMAQMCPKCGYTIRVDTDRCPECGEPVKG